MPAVLTYPGVYVEELESGVHTISGVATSIAAFVGRTLFGPTDDPTVINSWADFERTFGGLWEKSPLSVAVNDFFQNGGGQAVIVRVFSPTAASTSAETFDAANSTAESAAAVADDATPADVETAAKKQAANYPANSAGRNAADLVVAAIDKVVTGAGTPTKDDAIKAAKDAVDDASKTITSSLIKPTIAHLAFGDFKLIASSPGSWAKDLRARIDAADDKSMFMLTVRDGGTGKTEKFANLSIDPKSKRRADTILARESELIRVDGNLPAKVPDLSKDPTSPKQWWEDDDSSAKVDPADPTNGDEPSDTLIKGSAAAKTGLYALDNAEEFNLLCIPPRDFEGGDIAYDLISAAIAYCVERRAIFLVDPPSSWKSKAQARKGIDQTEVGDPSENAAIYFPHILRTSPFAKDGGAILPYVPCGAVAGVIARTDTRRGVWKAPAGLDATLVNAPDFDVPLTDAENGELNPKGINCLRAFPAAGRVVWGARTRKGADALADQWKYLPVRRTALYIEESLYRGTKWVVFEPNDEPLWASIRLNVGSFMHNMFRQGAFQGATPRDAYFVKCDKDTTTQSDIDRGIVNILVGFAPLKPAEFVVLQIQQIAGQIQF